MNNNEYIMSVQCSKTVFIGKYFKHWKKFSYSWAKCDVCKNFAHMYKLLTLHAYYGNRVIYKKICKNRPITPSLSFRCKNTCMLNMKSLKRFVHRINYIKSYRSLVKLIQNGNIFYWICYNIWTIQLVMFFFD